MRTTHSIAFKNTREDGFTLTELLVVIVMVGILCVLLLPALAGTKPNSQAFQCLENLRQLTLGWQMYAEDNNGMLAPNGQESTQARLLPTDPSYLPGGVNSQWCPGLVNAFNALAGGFIKAGLIYPYVNNTNLYRCPSDLKTFLHLGINYPQARSYSMNCCIAPLPPPVAWNGPGNRVFKKDTDFTLPGPAMTFVLIDENENSINDTLFCNSPTQPNWWQDVPATRHSNAGSLSLADGFPEQLFWRNG